MIRSVSSHHVTARLTVAITVAAACGDGTAPENTPDPEPVQERVPAALAADQDSLSLPVGGAGQLEVTVLDDSGGVLSGIPVEFSSSDTTVVIADAQGLVTAVGSGAASITMRAPEHMWPTA